MSLYGSWAHNFVVLMTMTDSDSDGCAANRARKREGSSLVAFPLISCSHLNKASTVEDI